MHSLETIIQMNKRPGATADEAISEAREAAKPYQPTGTYISKATVRDQVISERNRGYMIEWLKQEAVRPPTQYDPKLSDRIKAELSDIELRDPTPPYNGTCVLCKEHNRLEYRDDHAIWVCRHCDAFISTTHGKRYLEDRRNFLIDYAGTKAPKTPKQWQTENPMTWATVAEDLNMIHIEVTND